MKSVFVQISSNWDDEMTENGGFGPFGRHRIANLSFEPASQID
jgi:hypothetical protein